VIVAVGGGSGAKSASTASSITTAHTAAKHAKAQAHHVAPREPSAPVASPAETSVAVLNGTETNGLAHAVSNSLRENGYVQATALNGRPPGANQVTVVEFAKDHRADAEGVARSLSVTRVQPMEAVAASLSGSATVVVIVGLDKAASVQ
jgi:LytR cell envelope-related transcriptional attenuator